MIDAKPHYHTTNPYPLISESEYPAFVALGVTGIPGTYGEWIEQQRAANLSRDRVGERPVPVPMTAAEFKAFCDGRRQGYVGLHLLHYAIEHAPR